MMKKKDSKNRFGIFSQKKVQIIHHTCFFAICKSNNGGYGIQIASFSMKKRYEMQ